MHRGRKAWNVTSLSASQAGWGRQSLDLVGDTAISPVQFLLDLDLPTKVSSSDVEQDAISGEARSTASVAAFLAAAVTLGLSIFMRAVCRVGACATGMAEFAEGFAATPLGADPYPGVD